MSLEIEMGEGAFLIYSTPIFREVQPDAGALCKALEHIVLEHEKAAPDMRSGGRNRSNQGGWRSEHDLFEWPEPEVRQLRDLIVRKLYLMMQLSVAGQPGQIADCDFSIVGWVNVNRDGEYNVMHNHPGNHWSGAFYPSIGVPDPSVQYNGVFEFYEPRGAATMGKIPGFQFGQTGPVSPQPGLLMIFPSFVQHAVHPYRGKGARISMAFNAKVERFEVKRVGRR